MAKDWKAECDKLRGEIAEVRRELDYYRNIDRSRRERDEAVRDKFKELLLDVLGRH